MIRFTTIENRSVAVEPRHIASAEAIVRQDAINRWTLLSGSPINIPCVRVTLVTGLCFTVDDPNGTIVSQIEDAKKGE